jgi:hypothetical protein
MHDPLDPLIPLAVAVHEIGDASHPLHMQTLRRRLQRLDALELDKQYRQSVRQSLMQRLRDHFREHGRLTPPSVRSLADLEAAE